ncbi:antibiotic biosynthesis monooxygenase family protein [Deltaproteobacteria bacterium TL4]
MSVKIFIKRRITPEQEEAILPMLLEMRKQAMTQPGYVLGETLVNYDDPEEHLVIATWDSIESWNQWLESETRANLQSKVDGVLGEITLYQIYHNG